MHIAVMIVSRADRVMLIIHWQDLIVRVVLMMDRDLDFFIWIQLIAIFYLGDPSSSKTAFFSIVLDIWDWVMLWITVLYLLFFVKAIVNNLIPRLSQCLALFVFFILLF